MVWEKAGVDPMAASQALGKMSSSCQVREEGKVFNFCGGAGLCLHWDLYLCSSMGSLALVAIPVCAGAHICSLLQYKNVFFGRE